MIHRIILGFFMNIVQKLLFHRCDYNKNISLLDFKRKLGRDNRKSLLFSAAFFCIWLTEN